MDKEGVLIVGINSFLGLAILALVKEEYSVTGIFHNNKNRLPDNIELVQVDSIEDLKYRNYKTVYLVSSYVPGLTTPDDSMLVAANILLPSKIVQLFPNSRIVFCSSVAVYENRPNNNIISINEILTPISKYALSKVWGEEIIKQHRSYAIIRISSMYGVGMNEVTFLPKVITNALINQEIVLLGDGGRMQNYIHVKDVAKIAVMSSKHLENMSLLAVSDKSYSNREIAELVLQLVPGDLKLIGSDHSISNIYDNEFTHSTLGRFEFTNIKEGLKELIQWIKKKS